MVMDETEVQILINEARAEELEKTVRFMTRLNIELYGHYGHLVDMLREGKIDEVITELEASRKRVEDKLINR
jgi:hypothetical protein